MNTLSVPSSSAQSDLASYIKCMICYEDFNSAKANRPDYEITKRIFDNYTRLLKVQLILPMQWNFRYEHLPFCTACTLTVTKLLELNEKLHMIQNEIRVTLRNIKIEILKTQDANLKRMVEPLGRRRGTRGCASHLEKVDYFRSFAVKDMDPDVRLNVNNVLLKTPVPGQQIPKVALPFLQKQKQDTGYDVNSAVVQPFFVQTGTQDDEDYSVPSPMADDIGEDNSDGATNAEDVGEDSLPEGLVKLPSNAPLETPRDYVTHYFTKVQENTYQCNICDRKMSLSSNKSNSNLKRHVVKSHEGKKGYQCKFCLMTFLSSSKGVAHIHIQHSTPSKQVLTYKGSFNRNIPKPPISVAIPTEEILKRVIDLKGGDNRPDREIYKRHYKKVGDIYVCKICTRQMKSIKDIVRHVHASHKGKPSFQCSYCDKKFMERYMCVKHLKIAHDPVMQEEYQALIVNENEETADEVEEEETFSTTSANTAQGNCYTKIGNGMFKCKKCEYTSVQRSNVVRHNKRRHQLTTRPGLVKFSFSKKTKPGTVTNEGSPSKVKKLHNAPTVSSDGQDGVLYTVPKDYDALVKPFILDGKSKSKKRFKCKSCTYGSMSLCNVKRHVRDTHLKIRPFTCSFCKQGFYSRQKCQLHVILTHPQENESSNVKKHYSDQSDLLSNEDYGPPTLLPEVDRHLDENQSLESASIDSKEGILNDSRLRRRKSNVSYVNDVQDVRDDDEIERLCITLPKSSKLPFSPELLSKYISESNSSFCLVCEKNFTQISHHIANVHEEVRHFQCFLCNRTFYFRSKCIAHIKEKCLKENKTGDRSKYDSECASSSSQFVTKLANPSKPVSVPKISKPKASSKKAKAISKSQPLQSGVYQDYYERLGKRYKCKICKKRIPDSRRIATHYVANHKDIRPFACGHCEEKFYAKPMLTKHIYVSHPEVAAELAKEREQNINLNGPQHTESMDTGEASQIASDVSSGVTTVKTESTWVEFSHPTEEARDQFLESNEPETVSISKSSSFKDMESSIPESSSSRNVASSSVEKSIENDAPKVDYGVSVINQQSNLNCDPFIDKESSNKCKVCNKSFKLRKLVIDHIKNVHLGVRRYQCEFCSKKYYHLAACKQHVEDNHPPGNIEQSSQDRIPDISTGEQLIQNDISSDLQISNVRSQASINHNPIAESEEIIMDSGMMDVEEPMSFEPWRELPSSQDKNIEPFFAVQSDESEEEEEEPQFVVQEQNGFGFSTDYEMTGTGIITDEVSIYDIVGTENIIELPYVPPVQSDTLDYSETGTGFSCNICQKDFAVRKSMINHVNVKHKQVARFRCKMCDKNYYHKYHVAQHIASIHMRKDIFKCRVCEKSYGHASGLKKHYAAAHGSVNFQSREQWCTLCKLPFQSPQDLISHMSRIHPV